MMESGKMVNETWDERCLVALLNRIQDKGEKTYHEPHSITVETIRNRDIAQYLIKNGVYVSRLYGIPILREWVHKKDCYGNGYSECSCCGKVVDGYVNFPHCPHCGERIRG
mgnify:CR=1 FL=1